MSVGTAFHPATAPLNRKQQWREWSGYFASSAYADAHGDTPLCGRRCHRHDYKRLTFKRCHI